MSAEKVLSLFKKYLTAPPKCIFCGSESCKGSLPLCENCFPKYVGFMLKGCEDCGSLPADCHCFSVANCADIYWLFNYSDDEVKRLVNLLKRRRDACACRFLACRLADMICAKTGGKPPYDCVCFVPRNPRDRRYYNHDHAEELATPLARLLGLPCLPLLKHTGAKGEQKRLAREFRGQAVKTRFEIDERLLKKGKIPYKAPLLTDDVVTTGYTAGECAHILKKYGARLVGAAFIAHTPEIQRRLKREAGEPEPDAPRRRK